MLGGHFQVVFLKVLGAVSTTVDPLGTCKEPALHCRHLQGASVSKALDSLDAHVMYSD